MERNGKKPAEVTTDLESKGQAFVGIDVSKDKHDVQTLSAAGKKRRKSIKNDAEGIDAFVAWLIENGLAGAHACMEATGRYGIPLALALHKAGFTVSVVNPARIKSFGATRGVRNKTDSADAALILEYCAAMAPAPWTPQRNEVSELQDLLLVRKSFVDDRTRWANRAGSGLSGKALAAARKQVSDVEAKIAEVNGLIAEHISQDDGDGGLDGKSRLLQTVPGVGPATAAVILAALPEKGLPDGKAAAAFAGLNPGRRESGTSVMGQSRISKMGNSTLRSALYLAALSAMRFNPGMKAFSERLEERGKTGKQRVCAVARKLIVLCNAMLRSGLPFDKDHVPDSSKKVGAGA